MATVIRSHLAPVLLFLQAQIVNIVGWPAERVRICPPQRLVNYAGRTAGGQFRGGASINHPHGDGYALIWPGPLVPNNDCVLGGGRVDARLLRTFYVSVRTRLGVDEQSDARQWLTDPTLGHAYLEEAVIDALLLCQPNDAGDVTGNQGNWLVTQPIQLRTVDVPELEKLDPDWGESRIACDISYPFAASQDRQ